MSNSLFSFSPRFKRMEIFIQELQESICRGINKINRRPYHEDTWDRADGGWGKTRIYSDGFLLEKGGVNVSSVHGEMPEEMSKIMKVPSSLFAACGLSLVLHPYSPRIPTIHMNIRYFEMKTGESWYGGGIDLTPYVPLEEDFIYFHRQIKQCCEEIIPNSYQNFKQECDHYFTLKHRQEMRGIGGVFFDYLKSDLPQKEALVKSLGKGFLEAYMPITRKRLTEPFSQEEQQFQHIRRGRYVEFNLIYDRGTLFGLKTGGRVESILMSLPTTAAFPYNWQPKYGFEKKMLEYYQPRDWVGSD